MRARRHVGGCRSGSLAKCLEQTFSLKKLMDFAQARRQFDRHPQRLCTPHVAFSHAHGTITKADVAIAELGTELDGTASNRCDVATHARRPNHRDVE
jgi:hypothetical protein